MAKFDDKVNGNTVDATDYNNTVRALKNAIEDSDQVINDGDNTQVSKAMANYAGASTYYTDSGIADAYVLNAVGSFKAPTAYVDGLEFRFRAGNVNTGASTANPGGLGVKNIKKPDGTTDVVAGDIGATADSVLRYDFGNDVLILTKQIIEEATNTNAGISILPNQITISNGTDIDHDIDFTAGNFIFSDGSGQAVASALTKQIDATWAAGDAAGGLADALTVAADTTYYCFALSNASGSSVDFGFDTSLTATNLLADTAVIAAGLTKYKKIASLITDSSSNILNGTYTFNQDGSYDFEYTVGILDFNDSNPGTSAVLKTMSAPPNSRVKFYSYLLDDSVATDWIYTLFTSTDQTDTTPSSTAFSLIMTLPGGSTGGLNFGQTGSFQIRVDGSSQLRYRMQRSDADISLKAYVTGWIETNL